MTCAIIARDVSTIRRLSKREFDAVSEDRWRDDGGQGDMMESAAMRPAMRYPLYLIANDKGVLVANTHGKDCVLLFHSKQLAERHIAENTETQTTMLLYPLAVPDADAFRQGLESLPDSIHCAIWDATVAPGTFVYMEMHDLLHAIED